MNQHLFLIGYRGSGKSSVGKRLATRLARPFFDSDEWIEQRANKSIRAIFAEDGEPVFRDIEAQVLHELSQQTVPSVLSLGGGAILRATNRDVIRAAGRCVWLTATPDRLASRIASDALTSERRPSLTSANVLDEISRVLSERQPLYAAAADIQISTDEKAIESIVEEIVFWNEANSVVAKT
jgi:shikimate kinase